MRKEDINAIAAEVSLLIDMYNDEVLTVKEVANLLGKSSDAIRKLCQRDLIPYHKHYGTYYFSHLELKNFLLERAGNK